MAQKHFTDTNQTDNQVNCSSCWW